MKTVEESWDEDFPQLWQEYFPEEPVPDRGAYQVLLEEIMNETWGGPTVLEQARLMFKFAAGVHTLCTFELLQIANNKIGMYTLPAAVEMIEKKV